MGFFDKLASRMQHDPEKDAHRQSSYFGHEVITPEKEKEYQNKEVWLEEYMKIQNSFLGKYGDGSNNS